MTPARSDPGRTARAYDVVIIGAGFAGLRMLHSVRALGLTVRVFEGGSDVGGTWYWNRYPGARCDVPSLEYAYAFSDELAAEWQWTERYATQPEILRYVHHVADRFDLRRDVQLDTWIDSVTYDEASQRWRLTSDGATIAQARYVVTAVGCLSAAKPPEFEGVETFGGRVLETHHWPHEPVDLTGQRVGVIGTGSSGIQCIPILADQASHLTVFQRTPNFSLPARNAPLAPEVVDEWRAHHRERRRQALATRTGLLVERGTRSALEVSEEERLSRYEQAWHAGAFANLSASFTDIMTSPEANETAAEFVRGKIRSIVHDPTVAEDLLPRDYPYGTKRVCLDTDYYAVYNRPNVTLVTLRRTPIERIVPAGVVTSAGTHELDVLVLATGFDAVTGPLLRLNLTGRGGRRLADAWAGGPRAYLGLQVAGFPNLFTITGPGSPSIVSNVMVSIEQHVEWIADCLAHLVANGFATIEPEPAAEEAWTSHVGEVAAATLYPRANSWFMGANVPGKPRVFLPYLGGVAAYRERCEAVVANGYEGFRVSPSRSVPAEPVASA